VPTLTYQRHMPNTYSDPKYIHRGGFGIVERVSDSAGRLWARKTFDAPLHVKADPRAHEKARRRFQREINEQAKLSHPHIMPILDHALTDNPPWYIMPLAEEDFYEQIDRDRATGAVSLDPLLHILAGLEEMHRFKLVHRDLKPGNVLRLGDKWVISDFGFVLPQSRDTTVLTSKRSWGGTDSYAPPEQITDFAETPPQADIYAFGCILDDLVATRPRIPFAQVRVPGHVLSSIIERCTEPNPADRFQNVASLRNALVGVLTTPAVPMASHNIRAWVDELSNRPGSVTEATWIDIDRFLEQHVETEDAHTLLKAIDLPQIDALHARAPRVFPRLVVKLARWVRDGNFDFAYCDVLGSRLNRIYSLGDVRERAEATMAVFFLGHNHNRWSVMRQFVQMASPSIDEDLADRLTGEMYTLGWDAFWKFDSIANAIGLGPKSLHPKIANALQRIGEQAKSHVNDDPFAPVPEFRL
jgi:hypothetical protein